MPTFTFTVSAQSVPTFASDSAEDEHAATAIRDLALDPVTGDLELLEGDLVFNYGINAIASDLASRLTTFGPGTTQDGEVLEGEWFLDTDLGVDFWGKVFRGAINESDARTSFAVEAAKTPGVTAIRDMVSDLTEREFVLTCDAVSDLGAVISITLSETQGV